MKNVAIRYHHEAEGWWADSEDLPGWTAAGDSLDELREQVRSAVQVFMGSKARIVEVGAAAKHDTGRD